MNYQEYKKIREEGCNALPIFWAFNKEQFKEGMAKFGLKESDTDKIYSLGAGGYFPKSKAKEVEDFFNSDNIEDLMKDYDFAYDAFYCEMANHEYHINYQGDWDVLNCFYHVEWLGDGADCTDYLNKMDIPTTVKQAYIDARSKFLKDADKNGWY